ncbi:unnamed protein product [Triticum turgidum subsp. durum]|uniref:Glycosyltransferase n=1 Tax=Triticum turgidum subsp. durum TaxID=4567 RepID=A0A9R1BIP3_TRITD|nr:unnamed protein product [Triticum turgidum subsp. durum]
MEMAAAAAGAGAGGLEVVVFPWLAFGHMIPFLELSKRLAAWGHAVAFVSTPRNLARLPPVPAHLSAHIRFVPLPLPAVEGLPEGAEVTSDLPPDKVELLKKAMDGLAAPLASFLADAVVAGRRPDWIIIDFCHHWVPPIADQHKVPCAAFLIFHAAFMAFIGPRWTNDAHPRTKPEDFTVPACHPSGSPSRPPPSSSTTRPGGCSLTTSVKTRQAGRTLTVCGTCSSGAASPSTGAVASWSLACSQSSLISCGSPPSPPGSCYLGRPTTVMKTTGRAALAAPTVARSYVGSTTLENIHELALGLELAGVHFLWALRKPAGTNNKQELLPAGFEERTQDRGVVCTGWVPQVKVLAHGAPTAFLTHCGWGSTIESFGFGLPLVMLPFLTDTPMIARAMAERGIGVLVPRDGSDGSFDREGVVVAVRRVMSEDEGKVFATNAKKLKELVLDERRQEQYIHELEEHLRRYKEARSSG